MVADKIPDKLHVHDLLSTLFVVTMEWDWGGGGGGGPYLLNNTQELKYSYIAT